MLTIMQVNIIDISELMPIMVKYCEITKQLKTAKIPGIGIEIWYRYHYKMSGIDAVSILTPSSRKFRY